MSKWRRIAIKLFPDYNRGMFAFQHRNASIYWVFFELLPDLDNKIETGDFEWIQNVFIYCEWCFKQRSRNPDIWNVTATAFLEHLADEDERVELIPRWLKPDIFEDMWDEVKKRRERKGAGLAQKLLDEYNKANNSKEEYQQYL